MRSLIDGKSDQARKNVVVEIAGEQIKEVGNTSPANSGVIDLSGETCLPGLIDTHPHVLLQGDITAADHDEQLLKQLLKQSLKQSPEYRTVLGTVNARRALEYGFTTIRDLETEGAGYADVDIRNAINRGVIPGPRAGGDAGTGGDRSISAAGLCAQCAGAAWRTGGVRPGASAYRIVECAP